MKKLILVLTFLAFLALLLSPGCKKATIDERLKKGEAKRLREEMAKTANSHFGFMPAELDFAGGKAALGHFDRPHFELFGWDLIEPEKGEFSFDQTDEYVRRAESYGFHILANIQSYNHWDQNEPPAQMGEPKPIQKPAVKPNDIKAYQNFVKKLVERYDGDGKDDMPGLVYPIKHWEVLNEPEMNKEPLFFFKGTPQDYAEILKATYEAIKDEDKKAQVLSAGMAGMEDWMVSFWQQVFDAGGAQYFDIANIHSIGHGEPLNIPEFKGLLARNGIDKPIWVTEVQIEDRKDKKNPDYYAQSLARSYIFALANGADKLFYVNLKLPAGGLPPESEGGPGFSDLSTLISESGEKQPLFYAHKTIAQKLDKLSKAEKIKEQIIGEAFGGKVVTEGQYKFTVGGKVIYALWGSGAIPAEVTGNVKVTNLNGETEEVDASEVALTDSPIFVEAK